MRSSSRLGTLLMGCAALAVALAPVAHGDGGQAPVATAAKNCKPPAYPGDGYFTSLTVSRTSCATGKSVALAYYRCRTKRSSTGTCGKRVSGYRCSERRTTIPTEINARVTCRRGERRIVHTYQQNT